MAVTINAVQKFFSDIDEAIVSLFVDFIDEQLMARNNWDIDYARGTMVAVVKQPQIGTMGRLAYELTMGEVITILSMYKKQGWTCDFKNRTFRFECSLP